MDSWRLFRRHVQVEQQLVFDHAENKARLGLCDSGPGIVKSLETSGMNVNLAANLTCGMTAAIIADQVSKWRINWERGS